MNFIDARIKSFLNKLYTLKVMAPNVAKRLNIINNSVINEFKYRSGVIKKHFYKELKEDNDNFGFVTVIMLIMMLKR